MTKIYQQAFSEVNEILSYLSKENYNKIPKEVIDAIEENKDDDYVFFIDTTIPFEEQEILEESKAILFNIYKDYLSNIIMEIELNAEEQVMYLYKPKLLSEDLYGTTELWDTILLLNDCVSVIDFKPVTVKIYDPEEFKALLNEIMLIEESLGNIEY